jgi:hypothetical protein
MSLPPKLKDYRIKPLKRFYRPYFSPYRNSYEIDHIYAGSIFKNNRLVKKWYLGCININTRYLFMEFVENLTQLTVLSVLQRIKDSIEKMTNNESTIRHIRADGSKSFGSDVKDEEINDPNSILDTYPYIRLGHMEFKPNVYTRYFRDNNIELYLVDSKYTEKSRIIDRAVGTIRYKLGENPYALLDTKAVAEAVEIYNNTRHSAFNYEFSPKDVQLNPDLEEYFIRQQLSTLDNVNDLQYEEGFFNYKSGDVLLIHLNQSKTDQSMTRKRRIFNRLAIFLRYLNGNVMCNILTREDDGDIVMFTKAIVLPIYFTKFVAPSLSELPRKYHQLIF